MERLWAPWRVKYVTNNNKDKECVFCKKSQQKKDRENLVIFRGQYCFSLLNIYPYNNGHIMVAPYRHIADITCLKDQELLEMFKLIKESEIKIKSILSPDGFNIGINIGKAAGAGMEKHLHMHLVPRWGGDTNFMPVVSDTRVISQSLKELYQLLKT
ncbi:MAG: HIT domain-containing protein [Candidatus Saelkia tenebricola]|nr:HIT domain-containing protein [Candidatus Saelkia tenebricola]